MVKYLRNIFLLVFTVSMVISCAPTKSTAYFQQKGAEKDMVTPDKVYFVDKNYNEPIRVGDILYITVKGGNNETNNFEETGVSATTGTDLMGYKVDQDGFIRIPYLKQVKVGGLTINDAIDTLESQLSQYIYMPTVAIRIINCRVSIMGEVRSPGVYVFNRDQVSIYEAIATAGDIQPFGNRSKVMIIRQNGNNIEKKYINITSDNIINTPWYYVQSDDIIYIVPMTRKMWGLQTYPWGLIYSLFSSTIVMITFLKTPKL